MDESRTPASARTRLEVVKLVERRRSREAQQSASRGLLVAAGVGPATVSEGGLLGWDKPTTEGVVEIFGTARVAEHRTEIKRDVAALRRSDAAAEAALSRCDERWGVGQ